MVQGSAPSATRRSTSTNPSGTACSRKLSRFTSVSAFAGRTVRCRSSSATFGCCSPSASPRHRPSTQPRRAINGVRAPSARARLRLPERPDGRCSCDLAGVASGACRCPRRGMGRRTCFPVDTTGIAVAGLPPSHPMLGPRGPGRNGGRQRPRRDHGHGKSLQHRHATVAWRRTSKFDPQARWLRALTSTLTGARTGALWVAIACVIILGPGGTLVGVLLQTAGRQSLAYLAAPALALLAEHDISSAEQRATAREPGSPENGEQCRSGHDRLTTGLVADHPLNPRGVRSNPGGTRSAQHPWRRIGTALTEDAAADEPVLLRFLRWRPGRLGEVSVANAKRITPFPEVGQLPSRPDLTADSADSGSSQAGPSGPRTANRLRADLNSSRWMTANDDRAPPQRRSTRPQNMQNARKAVLLSVWG